MDAVGLLAQQLVIALAVMASVAYLVQRQWPDGMRRVRGAMAVRLLRMHGRPAMQAVGRRLAPPPRAVGACGGCNGCGPHAGA